MTFNSKMAALRTLVLIFILTQNTLAINEDYYLDDYTYYEDYSDYSSPPQLGNEKHSQRKSCKLID